MKCLNGWQILLPLTISKEFTHTHIHPKMKMANIILLNLFGAFWYVGPWRRRTKHKFYYNLRHIKILIFLNFFAYFVSFFPFGFLRLCQVVNDYENVLYTLCFSFTYVCEFEVVFIGFLLRGLIKNICMCSYL